MVLISLCMHELTTSTAWSILIPRTYDPSGLRQGTRALAGPDFLSLHGVFVSYSQPVRFVRFDGKSVNRELPVLDQPRGGDFGADQWKLEYKFRY